MPENTEQEAQLIVARILKKYQGSELLLSPGKPQPEAHQDEPSKDQDIRGVDINSVQHNSPRSVGGEAIALHALQRAGLSEKLKELGFNQNQLHAAIGNIIGRMIQPGSELSTHTWLQHHTALGDLLDFDYTRQGLSALYRASDLLWQHRDAIESHLYQQHAELFDIKESIVLYDLTNTFFEGTGKYNDLAAFGHSKEKRSDCPLVTLAMVLDSSGFTRHSQILPGNVSEPETLQKMILALYTESKDKDKVVDTLGQTTLDLQHPLPTIVMDAGIASEDNISWLKEQGYTYVVVSRKQHLEFDPDKAVMVKEKANDTVHAMQVIRGTNEIELYCHSEKREAKESAITERFSTRLEEELNYLAAGLNQPRRLKKAKKVCEKIGRLRQKYSRVSRYYDIQTETDEKGEYATALHFKRISVENTSDAQPGVYCLRSNQMQWDEQQMWSTYIMLTDLEAVFRSLKSELGMRPVFHQKTERVEGHLFITLLAYNLVHQLRLSLKVEGIHDSWETLRNKMKTQVRSTIYLRGEKGEHIHMRQSSYPDASQQPILKVLKLGYFPGKKEKTVILAMDKTNVVT